MAIPYPSNLPKFLKASKARKQAATFDLAEPRRGYAYLQETGTDVPVYWDVTFRFGRFQAQQFWLWFVTELDRGKKRFTIPIDVEDGLATHTCRFVPDSLLPAMENGGVWTYTATIEARKLILTSDANGGEGGGSAGENGDPIKTLSLLHFDNSGLPDTVSTNSVDLSESLHDITATGAFNGFAVTNQVYAYYTGNDGRQITNTGLTVEAWVLPQTVSGSIGFPKFNHVKGGKSTASEELFFRIAWSTNETGDTTFSAECSATKNYSDYTGFYYDAPWTESGLVHVALVLSTPNFINPITYSVYVNGSRVTTGTFSVAEYPNTLTWDGAADFEVRCSSTSTTFRTDEARLSNVPRYSGATITVPTAPFVID